LTAALSWLNPSGVLRPKLVICAHCDAVHRRRPLPPRGHAYCTRCGSELYAARRTHLEAWLALTAASGVAYLVANLNPIVEIDLRGESTRASLFDALVATWDGGAPPVAALAAACAFLFPLMRIGLELFVLANLHLGRRPAMLGRAMRLLHTLRPWSMVEVFMLGVVVSLVKLGGQTTVIPGPGLAGFAVLTVLLTLLATFDTHSLWEAAERVSA
jgi:paraquat-inducible protein A